MPLLLRNPLILNLKSFRGFASKLHDHEGIVIPFKLIGMFSSIVLVTLFNAFNICVVIALKLIGIVWITLPLVYTMKQGQYVHMIVSGVVIVSRNLN